MARYSIATTKTTGAAAGLVVQLRAGAARDVRVFEVGVSTSTAVAGTVGLIRPTAVGATFTSTGTGQPHDNISGAGVAVVDTAATTPPTIGTTYLRQFSFPATAGSGVIWTFPEGLVIPTSGSIALWQTSALAVGYVAYFSYEE
jgi:hypothetical protein